MKKNNNKGFTLAELLIVVAIIAVLVAIAIPIFTTQLEKSREAVDAANLRAAYAEVMTSVLTDDIANDTSCAAVAGVGVPQKQTIAKWDLPIDWPEGLDAGDIKDPVDGASTGDYWTVKWDATNNKVVAQ